MEEKKEISSTTGEWRLVSDPKQASCLFTQELLNRNRDSKRLFLSVDIRTDKKEQDRALFTFYQRDGVRWASPLQCQLQGDVATGSGVDRHMMSTVIFRLINGFHLNLGNAPVIKLFEGEPDHLIPSVSEELLNNNMFTVAGRMIGHSFLHHGPSFPGLSPAIIHVLFGGSAETAPVTIRECPDLNIRETLEMIDGDTDLKESDCLHQLCLTWNLPAPNATNRKRLSKSLLLHAVIKRTSRQVNQLRRGLNETGLWPLIIHRRDVIPILFPRESDAQITPEMILDSIIWPSSVTDIFESYRAQEKNKCDHSDVCRVSGYLKTFIENASPAELKSLVKFWIGWELPATEMKVEIVEATFPTALTCFEKLRLPRHYTAYDTFHQHLCACISTSYSGFGCV
ncbi:uncharacterized protein V6R79_024307 [Siganus canaliculatus]